MMRRSFVTPFRQRSTDCDKSPWYLKLLRIKLLASSQKRTLRYLRADEPGTVCLARCDIWAIKANILTHPHIELVADGNCVCRLNIHIATSDFNAQLAHLLR